MKLRHIITTALIALMIALIPTLNSGNVAFAGETATYRVTIQNLSNGQPLSPPVAATHRAGIRMFKAGALASPELEALAEDGNQIPLFDLFNASNKTTEVVDVGMPLTPFGTTPAGFDDAETFYIQASPGDKFSIATMLICTNDGFTGLDGVKLPKKGSKVYLLNGYDAGTEDNTELSADIVDPCSGLGPLPLAGDPNGNENAAVDTQPPQAIQLHPNIAGTGDLSADAHGWTDPLAKVTITRVDDNATRFLARLSGVGELPAVATDASGQARFKLVNGGTALKFALKVSDIDGVTQAHIHAGLPSENGGVVAFLFGPVDPTGPVNGVIAQGTLTEADLTGDFAGDWDGFVDALRNGDLYVNVHTDEYPSGEIRGQIGTGGK